MIETKRNDTKRPPPVAACVRPRAARRAAYLCMSLSCTSVCPYPFALPRRTWAELRILLFFMRVRLRGSFSSRPMPTSFVIHLPRRSHRANRWSSYRGDREPRSQWSTNLTPSASGFHSIPTSGPGSHRAFPAPGPSGRNPRHYGLPRRRPSRPRGPHGAADGVGPRCTGCPHPSARHPRGPHPDHERTRRSWRPYSPRDHHRPPAGTGPHPPAGA